MRDETFIYFLEMLRMRVPSPTVEGVASQVPRIRAILETLPDVQAYLKTVGSRFEFNMWSGWLNQRFGEIDPDTCFIHQMRLLRLVADDILRLVNTPPPDPARDRCPPVSIIIPAWNQWAYTKMTLATLFSTTVWPEYEVIVIDNASADETPQELPKMARLWPNLRVIRNRENLGFSGANNQGVEAARHEHLIFLNNDMIIRHADWIGQMFKSFHALPNVGATGQFAVVDCFTAEHEDLYQKVFFPNIYVPVSWISGYNLLTTRRALTDAGMWRGDLYGPAGYEDIHLGYAMREAGWLCVSPGQIPIIEHLIGRTRFTDAGKTYVASASPRIDKYQIFRRHFGSREHRVAAA